MSDLSSASKSSSICLRLAASLDEIVQACQLVHTQYCDNGLISQTWHNVHFSLANLLPSSVTLIGKQGEQVVATLTSIFAHAPHLPSGPTFEQLSDNTTDHIDVEGTKFAVNRTSSEEHPSLASDVIKSCEQLWTAHKVSAAYVVVHPRHVAFWKRRFGFTAISDAKPCGRVQGSPGILMKKDFSSAPPVKQNCDAHYLLSEQEAGMLLALNLSTYQEAQYTYQHDFLKHYPHLSRIVQTSEHSDAKLAARCTLKISAQTFKQFAETIKTILSKSSLKIDFPEEVAANILMIGDSLQIFSSITKILELLYLTEKDITSTILQFSLDRLCSQKYSLNCKISFDNQLEEGHESLTNCLRDINRTWNSFSDQHRCSLIEANSETTIHMQFPMPQASPAILVPWENALSRPVLNSRMNNRNVLLATACPSEGMFLATLIKRMGFKPLISRDGESALDIVNSSNLEFAILSFHLPNIQTAKLLSSLKSQQFFLKRKNIPIFGLSSSEAQKAQMLAAHPKELSGAFSVPYSAKDVILALIHFKLLEFETQIQPTLLSEAHTQWSGSDNYNLPPEIRTF